MTHARRAASALEEGRLSFFGTRAIASAMGPILARALTRPAIVPRDVFLVCVGGATVGGSGKSRVAAACVRALPGSVLVAHGYRARDRRVRFVEATESVEAAGDEALAAARSGLRVAIGPTRQAAIDLAAAHADTIVLDGPLAVTHPPRRSVSLLAVDADAPWGSGLVVPAGDLRAPREALLALADEVVHVPRSVDEAALPPRPFGLFTALARPQRLIRALRPDRVVSAPDHGPAPPASAFSGAPVWVATPKCALHLAGRALRVHVLRDDFKLTPTWAALTVRSPRG